jgi:hypothetical protein
VQDGFVWGNQIIPILDNQFLPVFRTAAIPSDILTPKAHRRVEKMRVGNNPVSRVISSVLLVTIL